MFLENSKVFQSKLLSSRITSANVQNSERWLGYFLGPTFVLTMYYIAGQTYLNMFYTDVLKLSPLMGGMFLALLPIVSKVLDAITNIAMGRVIDNTRTKEGNPLLRDTVRKLTDKPVFCICTHGHIDHANGASLFEEAYLHSKDFDLYKKHSNKDFIIHSGYEGSGKKPTKLLRMPGYKDNIHFLANLPRRELIPLDDIPAFDLGGRVLTWTPVPGHTQGSIAVLDEANHAAFDGDAAGQGPWIYLPESSPLEEYADTIRHYRELLTAKGITQHYVGHSKNGLPTTQIDKLCAVCDYAVARRRAGKRCGIPVHLGAGDAVFIYKNHNAVFTKP